MLSEGALKYSVKINTVSFGIWSNTRSLFGIFFVQNFQKKKIKKKFFSEKFLNRVWNPPDFHGLSGFCLDFLFLFASLILTKKIFFFQFSLLSKQKNFFFLLLQKLQKKSIESPE